MSFQLGASLRNAREAQGLTFEEVARATRIRPQFLAALETERFDRLPGGAYSRSFLREYAEQLGLEPRLFLEEYDARFGELRGPAAPLVRVRGPSHRLRSGTVALLTAIVLTTAILAWRFGEEKHPARVSPIAHTPSAPKTHGALARHRATRPASTRLVVVAGGRCWLSVRVGSESGALVWEGILDGGRSVRFVRRSLWIRVGAPWNVSVRVNGKRVQLPHTTSPLNMLFSAAAQPRPSS